MTILASSITCFTPSQACWWLSIGRFCQSLPVIFYFLTILKSSLTCLYFLIVFNNDIPRTIVNHLHFPLKPWRLFLSPTVEKGNKESAPRYLSGYTTRSPTNPTVDETERTHPIKNLVEFGVQIPTSSKPLSNSFLPSHQLQEVGPELRC